MMYPLRCAVLALTFFAFAAVSLAETEIEHQVHIKVMADDEMIDVELDDLDIGQSQQFFTDGGKQIVATRTEEGYEIDIEGRDEPILVRTGTNAFSFSFDDTCDGEDCPKHISIIKDVTVTTDGDGEGEARRMVFMTTDGGVHIKSLGESDTDGDSHRMVFVGSNGNVHIGDDEHDNVEWIEFDSVAAADKLLESGALDDLDEDKRQAILDAVRSNTHGAGNAEVKVKVLKIDREEQE